MHVSSICNIKTPEDKFTLNKMLFSIFEFLIISPFLVVGLRGGAYFCIKNCHPRVTFIFQDDPELMLLVTYGVCVLCLVSRPEDLRKIGIFKFSFWFSCKRSKCHLFC